MSSTFIIRCVYIDITAPQKGTAKCGIGSEGTVSYFKNAPAMERQIRPKRENGCAVKARTILHISAKQPVCIPSSLFLD